MSSFENRILAALAPAEAAELIGDRSPAELALAQPLYDSGDRVEWVYFVEDGLVSAIIDTAEGQSAEAGMFGVEGGLGLVEACGSGNFSYRAVVQVPGHAYRARASDCKALARRSEAVRDIVWRSFEFHATEARQSVACQSFHPVEARLARWLLESWERSNTGRDLLPLTQEFLAAMLGVQRTTVTSIAAELQKRGVISYSRGKVELRDIDGLEQVACECRKALIRERKRLTVQAA